MSNSVEQEAATAMGTKTEDGRPYGHLGALTTAQQECLRQMWDGLLAFLYDDQQRIKSLGIEEAFVDIVLKRNGDTATATPAEDAEAEAAAAAAAAAAEDNAPKKKGGFWGGLANGLSTVTSMARPKAADAEDEDVTCSSKRPVSLEELQQEFWNLIMHDHPDSLLLRFLRARKWSVVKALGVAMTTLQWRIREDVAGIIREGEAGLNTRPLTIGQSYIHNTDHNKRPVCYINVRFHNKDLQPFNDIRRFTIWVMETARLMIHAPVETADILFDLADFTMSNMDYRFVKFIVQCFQAYYPESLGVYMVSNAPLIFWGIWQMINPWLDPVVASKFHCARKLTDLQEFIAAEDLPPRLGGTDTYEYYYPPPREEDDLRLHDEEGRATRRAEFAIFTDKFLATTRTWINEAAAAKDGSDAGAEAFKKRDQIAAEMNVVYFKLDPYIRSRTFYHRLEVLGEDGSCDWSRLLSQEQYEAKLAAGPAILAVEETKILAPVADAGAAALTAADIIATEMTVMTATTETVVSDDGTSTTTITKTAQISTPVDSSIVQVSEVTEQLADAKIVDDDTIKNKTGVVEEE